VPSTCLETLHGIPIGFQFILILFLIIIFIEYIRISIYQFPRQFDPLSTLGRSLYVLIRYAVTSIELKTTYQLQPPQQDLQLAQMRLGQQCHPENPWHYDARLSSLEKYSIDLPWI
jgi:hypothetical protein